MRLLLLLAVVACASPLPRQRAPRPAPASPISDRMDTFEINGYVLVGAEYRPYIGKDELRDPEDVLAGFYPAQGEIPPGASAPNPESATREAIDCAQQSFTALQVFLAKNPPALRRIAELGEARGFVPRFYLSTNDYSRAADPYPPGVRPARLWYWKREPAEPSRPPGHWTWESTLTQTRACLVPQQQQIDEYLAETLRALESQR